MNVLKKKIVALIVLILVLTFIVFLLTSQKGDNKLKEQSVGNMTNKPVRLYDCGAIKCGEKVKLLDF